MSSEENSLQTVQPSKDAVASPAKGSRSRLSLAEQTAIRAMRLAGTNGADIARALGRHPETIRRYLVDSARDILHGNLEEYANMHLDGARIAAAKGDTRPAEWAMERVKVVEPRAQATENKGLTVQIGVLLPNLGTSASLAVDAGERSQVIDSEDLSD